MIRRRRRDAREGRGRVIGAAVLAVDERHGATDDRPESLYSRSQAEIRVLEVRLVLLRKTADGVEDLALQVRARKDDTLHVARCGVLVHVLLLRPDLLPPERVGKDVRTRMGEPPVRKGQPAA